MSEDSNKDLCLISRKSHNGKPAGDHMDLPPDYRSYCQYSATSAHKLNHSFSPNCAWDNAYHPCLGLVPW